MGAEIEFNETTGALSVRSSRLRSVELTAADIPGIVDEVPVLAIAAAVAQGTTMISDAGELRAKKSDRIAHTCGMLRAPLLVHAGAGGMVRCCLMTALCSMPGGHGRRGRSTGRSTTLTQRR